MKLQPIKNYKEPKYPTYNQVKNNKELLYLPLNKWKKIGVTTSMMIIISNFFTNVSNAEYEKWQDLDPSKIDVTDASSGVHNSILSNPFLRINEISPIITKRNYKWSGTLDKLDTRISNKNTSTDFTETLNNFFKWLIIQGII